MKTNRAEDGQAAEDAGQHPGVGPPRRVAPVGQEGIDDAGEQGDQAQGEGGVAGPVDPGADTHAVVL